MHRVASIKAVRPVAILLTLGIGLVACTPASGQPAASNLKGTLTTHGGAFNC